MTDDRFLARECVRAIRADLVEQAAAKPGVWFLRAGVSEGRISVRLVRDVLSLWPLLDPFQLDSTLPNWARRVLDLIGRHRSKSERLALDSFGAFRRAELGAGTVLPPMENLEAAWRAVAEVS